MSAISPARDFLTTTSVSVAPIPLQYRSYIDDVLSGQDPALLSWLLKTASHPADNYDMPPIIQVLNYDMVGTLYDQFLSNMQGDNGADPIIPWVAAKAITPPLIKKLNDEKNARFEVAGPEELRMCVRQGVPVNRIMFTNTATLGSQYGGAAMALSLKDENGNPKPVTRFVVDHPNHIERIAKEADHYDINKAGLKVHLRIMATAGESDSVTNYDTRFGAHPDDAQNIISLAKEKGIPITGIAFNPGTDSRDPSLWHNAIGSAKRIIEQAKSESDVDIKVLNFGGGWPAQIKDDIDPLRSFHSSIVAEVKSYFGEDHGLHFIAEPGRSICGAAGFTIGAVTDSKPADNRIPWQRVTLNTGIFNAGLLWGAGMRPTFLRQNVESAEFCFLENKQQATKFFGPVSADLDTPMGEGERECPIISEGDTCLILGTGAYAAMVRGLWTSARIPKLLVIDNGELREARLKWLDDLESGAALKTDFAVAASSEAYLGSNHPHDFPYQHPSNDSWQPQ